MNWNTLLSKEHFVESEQESIVCRNDYDTIICSTLFRRLQDKAQVFPLDDDDYVRTRLTHSLEVSAIGKKLGEYVFRAGKELKKDVWFETHTEKEFSDVLLCAGLVHDIGNPPFGHFGEYAIREWFQNHMGQLTLGGRKITEILSDWQMQDIYHFEGNAQSLRLLSKTPYQGNNHGFNLSYSVLGSIMKYPISAEDLVNNNPSGYKKMGYNFAERELFDEINQKTGMHGCRHPLSYLLEAADDIAYRTSDLEDAMVKKVVSFQQIREAFEQYMEKAESSSQETAEAKSISPKLKRHMEKLLALYTEELSQKGRKPELTAVQRWNQYLQSQMIQDAGDAFMCHYEEIMEGRWNGDLFDGTASGEVIEVLAKLSEERIYTSSIKIKTELFGRRVIDSLLNQFMPAAIVYDTDEPTTFIERRTIDMVSNFYKTMYRSESAGKSEAEKLYLRILMITDFISGMTDNYAKRMYQELFA